jgi:hypothetical protein
MPFNVYNHTNLQRGKVDIYTIWWTCPLLTIVSKDKFFKILKRN